MRGHGRRRRSKLKNYFIFQITKIINNNKTAGEGCSIYFILKIISHYRDIKGHACLFYFSVQVTAIYYVKIIVSCLNIDKINLWFKLVHQEPVFILELQQEVVQEK